jgi:protein gp37
MGTNTKISWTDHTANLWWGCTKINPKINPGCRSCYADTMSKRWGFDTWGENAKRRIIKGVWNDLKRWQNKAQKQYEIHNVLIGSMMDLFEKNRAVSELKKDKLTGERIAEVVGSYDDLRKRIFDEISQGMYPNLMFQMLTKRPWNINKMIPEEWKLTPPSNVMFGTSVVDNETAENLISELLKVNGKRFLSVEPQIEEISLSKWLEKGDIDWVICGGETGPGRRPFNPDWGRILRNECKIHKVPFFFKQLGNGKPIPSDLLVKEFYDN